MSVFRSQSNPIIQPKDVKQSRADFEVNGVFNAGVARFNSEVILMLRVAERPVNERQDIVLTAAYDVAEKEILTKQFSKSDSETDFSDPRIITTPKETYLTSISHLRVARSKDGISFKIEDAPAVAPANDYETFGVEDPRITLIEDTYYITYVGVSPLGITTCLISTKDFISYHRHGVMFCPENRDVLLFPERINGSYYALHRPVSPLFRKQDIWLAESPDLRCWGNHRCLIGMGSDDWDSGRVGGGAVPFKIDSGWLEIYHAADNNNQYCLGAVLLDKEKPWKVIAKTKEPILQPETDYEKEGFYGNVVFTCGLLYENEKLKIYYGAADTSICYAELGLTDCLEKLNV